MPTKIGFFVFFMGTVWGATGDVCSENQTSFQYRGQLRVRAETRGDRDMNGSIGDRRTGTLQRTRLQVAGQVSENTMVFAQIQDSRTWGTEASTASNERNLDLHQGYFQVDHLGSPEFSLRLGRQVLAYGDHRLIGSFEWDNVGRSFDALKLSYNSPRGTVDFWAAKVVEGNPPAPGPSPSDADTDFYGVYVQHRPSAHNATESYLLFKRDKSGANDIEAWTVGGRTKGRWAKQPEFDYTAEGAFQFGDHGGADISAQALAVNLGYTFPSPCSPRLGLAYAYGSGDGNPGDGKFKTFDNLFPTNHLHYGYMDYQSWKNVRNWQLSLSAMPQPGLNVKLDYHLFSLADRRDAWYGAGGGPNRTFRPDPANPGQFLPVVFQDPTGAAGSTVGRELDLTCTYAYRPELKLKAGYSFFFTGNFVDNVVRSAGGAPSDSDWGYLQATLSF